VVFHILYSVHVEEIIRRDADVQIYICSAQDQGWTTTEVALLVLAFNPQRGLV
jgi:hypothetical protein